MNNELPEAYNVLHASKPPSTRERWAGAILLFFMFTLLALLPRITEKFEVMYKEMELGALPFTTELMLGWGKALVSAPWIFSGLMFMLTWTYFSWVAQEHRRIWLFNILLLVLLAMGWIGIVMGLFMPLVGTLERIGR